MAKFVDLVPAQWCHSSLNLPLFGLCLENSKGNTLCQVNYIHDRQYSKPVNSHDMLMYYYLMGSFKLEGIFLEWSAIQQLITIEVNEK